MLLPEWWHAWLLSRPVVRWHLSQAWDEGCQAGVDAAFKVLRPEGDYLDIPQPEPEPRRLSLAPPPPPPTPGLGLPETLGWRK